METVGETHALLDGRFRGDERKRGKKRGRKENVGVDVTVMIGCEEAFRLREHRAQYRHSEGVFRTTVRLSCFPREMRRLERVKRMARKGKCVW